jgi:hypothetical protein
MDTRFWGGSGWRLLHMIATGPNANKSRTFWEMLPFVLPCKFCRASLTVYYQTLPIPKKQEEYSKWLYDIHNLVNQKLRDQGQRLDPDPPYEAVHKRYTEMLEQGCSRVEFPGWDFLFCVADNHPDSSPSKPMPDVPEKVPITLIERNRYNLLTATERKNALRKFWQSIPVVLPFQEWSDSWRNHQGSILRAVQNRRLALSWLWKIRCGMDNDLHSMAKISFYGLCKRIATHRSGCGKSTRAKTCRRIQDAGMRSARKTRRLKQR